MQIRSPEVEQEQRSEGERQGVDARGRVRQDEPAGAGSEERHRDDEADQREALEGRQKASGEPEEEERRDDRADPAGDEKIGRGSAEDPGAPGEQVRRQRAELDEDVAIEPLSVGEPVDVGPPDTRIPDRIQPAASTPEAGRRREREEHDLGNPRDHASGPGDRLRRLPTHRGEAFRR